MVMPPNPAAASLPAAVPGIEGNEDVTGVQFPHPAGVDGIDCQEAAPGAQQPEGLVQHLILHARRRHVVEHRQAHNRGEMPGWKAGPGGVGADDGYIRSRHPLGQGCGEAFIHLHRGDPGCTLHQQVGGEARSARSVRAHCGLARICR